MQTTAVLFRSVDQVEVGSIEISEPGPQEVLIQTAYSTVSPGTELRSLAGKQVGTERWPYIPGYSLSGRVIARGEGCQTPIGTKVYLSGTQKASEALLWGGHVGLAIAKEESAYVAKDEADLVALSFTHLAAIAMRGVNMSRVQPGEKVAVIGLGMIGQLSARLFGSRGAVVRAYDRLANRVSAAEAGHVDASSENPEAGWADIVVDCTGTQAAFAHSIAAGKAKAWGNSSTDSLRIVVQGSYPDTLTVPYDDLFRKEVSLIFPRDATPAEVRQVIELIERKSLNLTGLISVFSVGEAPATYRALQSGSLVGASFDWNMS
jgi:3-hydroxyethyl bacteriochlorophyllide a dehydrogenase